MKREKTTILRELACGRPGMISRPIITAVARAFDVSSREILSATRQAPIVRARHAVAWLLRRNTRMSLPGIGATLGRDHSTVLLAIRRAEELRATDAGFRAALARAELQLDHNGRIQ